MTLYTMVPKIQPTDYNGKYKKEKIMRIHEL